MKFRFKSFLKSGKPLTQNIKTQEQYNGMRMFVAIELEREVKENIISLMSKLKKEDFDIKWTEPENLHITLKFLGEVREDSVKEIENQIQSALKDVKIFGLSLQGVGFFGSQNFIRVLWVDVKVGKEKILDLMKKMNEHLEYIRKGEYPPAAHITIGRISSPKNKDLLLKKIVEAKDTKFGECSVKEIKLKKSVLTKSGPIYSDVKVFELG